MMNAIVFQRKSKERKRLEHHPRSPGRLKVRAGRYMLENENSNSKIPAFTVSQELALRSPKPPANKEVMMPRTREFSLRMQNQPGTLGKICQALADRKVNILAFQSM